MPTTSFAQRHKKRAAIRRAAVESSPAAGAAEPSANESIASTPQQCAAIVHEFGQQMINDMTRRQCHLLHVDANESDNRYIQAFDALHSTKDINTLFRENGIAELDENSQPAVAFKLSVRDIELRICTFCGKMSCIPELVRYCKSCKSVQYCSKQCQVFSCCPFLQPRDN